MSLNSTPSANRIHIGIFGKRNAGKSSVINAITDQNTAIVSDIKGTTTDPVFKAMELLPLGPVIIIDTPGLDDTGSLGKLRIQKSYQILNKTDIAILVVDGCIGITAEDTLILERIKAKKIPYLIVMNKMDLLPVLPSCSQVNAPIIWISTITGAYIDDLKNLIAQQAIFESPKFPIIRDLLNPSDFVILVVPIDKSAPKGRLILPQQQTIREILDAGAISIVVGVTELSAALTTMGEKVKLVITDSQAFSQVARIVPSSIPLTSFSILFARHKGTLDALVNGATTLASLENHNTILICEGCTHHRQCEDIGTVKLPRLIQQYTKKTLHFAFTSGTEFPIDLTPYTLIIHCGGCTLNEREMKYRIQCAVDAHIPITNYGIAIASMQGILKRSIAPLHHP